MHSNTLYRSSGIKDVIRIKVKKYAGYFNPETKSFSIDPLLTSFSDLQQILIHAFSLRGPFQITYLCRDDIGEKMFLSLLTDWDLDAAFLTSADPFLKLKVDAEPYQNGIIGSELDVSNVDDLDEVNDNKPGQTIQQKNKSGKWDINSTQKTWTDKLGEAFNKLTIWGNQQLFQGELGVFPVKTPLDDEEFRSFLDDSGRLVKAEELRLRIYHGGVDPSLRKVVWRLLLNVFPAELTGEERLAYIKRKSNEYEQLRAKWQAKADNEKVKNVSNMVWKDALRTDRTHKYFEGDDDNPRTISLLNILTTYALTHPRVSYCQGMSDIASPILVVMDNEAQTYICFCAIMRRLRHNFSTDGLALSTKFRHLAMLVEQLEPDLYQYFRSIDAGNMFFCYRWILLEMKREFAFDDAITMLEVMWSSLPPQPPDIDLPLEDDPDDDVSLPNMTSPMHMMNHNKHDVISREKRKQKKKKQQQQPRQTTTSPSPPNDVTTDDKQKQPTNKHLTTATTTTNTIRNSFEFLRNDFNSLLRDMKGGGNNSDTAAEKYDSLDEEDNDGMFGCEEDEIGYKIKSSSPLLHNHGNGGIDNDQNAPQSPWKPLPPPEEFGYGHPFLLFVALALLSEERDSLLKSAKSDKTSGYEELAMHFDKLVRRHSPRKTLSKAMKYFASYLQNFAAHNHSQPS